MKAEEALAKGLRLEADHLRDLVQEVSDLRAEVAHLKDTRNMAPSDEYMQACLMGDRVALQAHLEAQTAAIRRQWPILRRALVFYTDTSQTPWTRYNEHLEAARALLAELDATPATKENG